MSATISSLMTDDGGDTYYSDQFLQAIYSYMPYFKITANVTYETPDNHTLYKYDGDFFGLLEELGIPKKYHFGTMVLNGLRSSGDYTSAKMSAIATLDTSQIDLLESIYSAINTLS